MEQFLFLGWDLQIFSWLKTSWKIAVLECEGKVEKQGHSHSSQSFIELPRSSRSPCLLKSPFGVSWGPYDHQNCCLKISAIANKEFSEFNRLSFPGRTGARVRIRWGCLTRRCLSTTTSTTRHHHQQHCWHIFLARINFFGKKNIRKAVEAWAKQRAGHFGPDPDPRLRTFG